MFQKNLKRVLNTGDVFEYTVSNKQLGTKETPKKFSIPSDQVTVTQYGEQGDVDSVIREYVNERGKEELARLINDTKSADAVNSAKTWLIQLPDAGGKSDEELVETFKNRVLNHSYSRLTASQVSDRSEELTAAYRAGKLDAVQFAEAMGKLFPSA